MNRKLETEIKKLIPQFTFWRKYGLWSRSRYEQFLCFFSEKIAHSIDNEILIVSLSIQNKWRDRGGNIHASLIGSIVRRNEKAAIHAEIVWLKRLEIFRGNVWSNLNPKTDNELFSEALRDNINPPKVLIKTVGYTEYERAYGLWRHLIRDISDELPLEYHRLFIVWGESSQYDFPSLPSGRYAYWCANDSTAWQIKADGTGLGKLISENWHSLTNQDPVKVATFLLLFTGKGSRNTHHVIRDRADIQSMVTTYDILGEGGYVINERELAKVGDLCTWWVDKSADRATLQALTLMGWMHDKRNIGIETVHIEREGAVSYAKRYVISQNVFKETPMIMY